MKKLISLIFSFIPLILFIMFVKNFLFDIILEGSVNPSSISVFIFIALLLVITTFADMFWLMYKTFKHPTLSTGAKIVWMILLYFFNIFIYPIHWFIFIRRE